MDTETFRPDQAAIKTGYTQDVPITCTHARLTTHAFLYSRNP
jgi:hypothetical protein